MPVSFFAPDTPVLAQWVHEQIGYGSGNRSYALAQEYGLLLTKINMATATAKC